jgi:hypothetical protein
MAVVVVLCECAAHRAALLLELVEPNPGLGDRLQPSQVRLVLLLQQVEPRLQLRQTASFDSTVFSAVHAVLRFVCRGATLACAAFRSARAV